MAPSMIRVFISSTFRDMHAERDHLTRIVFPELRARCLARGVEFVGLDLRWGVTEEEAAERGALAVCLDEIETCRPFFVCLLGDRYGWVPPPEEIAAELFAAAEPPEDIARWYRLDESSEPAVVRLRRDVETPEGIDRRLAAFWEEHGLPGAAQSITAREILRGVFEHGYDPAHALFYLRAPGLERQEHFPAELAPVFVERDEASRTRLEELKRRIRGHRFGIVSRDLYERARDAGELPEDVAGWYALDDGAHVPVYRLRWDEDHPEDLADRLAGFWEPRGVEPMVVREYAAAYAGLRVDPSLLPAELSDAERSALADGLVAPGEFTSLSAEAREVFERHGTVGLDGVEALGERIQDDLWAAIETEIGDAAGELDAHRVERGYHERFVRDRTRLFIGREELLGRVLDQLQEDDPRPLVLHGAPGSGKSALLAEIARRCRERMPDALIVPHFIGVAPGSTALDTTLRSICEEIRRECGLAQEVPLDPDKLRGQLPVSLQQGGERRQMVLLVDALNQLDPAGGARDLAWLPFEVPPGARLLVSTLPGDVLERLAARVPEERRIEVPVLPEPDRAELVRRHLEARGRKLSAAQLAALLDVERRPDSGLPLYLLVALEELLLFGTYEALDERIARLPETVPELFGQVLGRLEQDHGREMTESICRWLSASRSGLTEPEILELLRRRWPALPTVRWTRFFRALEFYLRPVEQESLLDFYHDQLRFAALRRYLEMESLDAPVTGEWSAAHAELASYFRSISCLEGELPRWHPDRLPELALPPLEPATPEVEGLPKARGLAELPYHLTKAGAWDELHAVLTDLGFLEAKCAHVDVMLREPGESAERLYAGVYALQEDYRRALAELPAPE